MSHVAPISFRCRTTIGAYRIVAADTAGANYVVLPSAATHAPLGVTADTVKDVNQGIPVIIAGIAKVQFNDTCSSGSLIAADAAGLGVKHVDTTAGSYVVGKLIGPAVTSTGTVAEVLIQPHFKSIP